jgi:hypothetical protein
MDVPANETGSSGIFDGKVTPKPGKTVRETTKEWADDLGADAIRFQGHAGPAFLERYMRDPHGLDKIKKYREQFEAEAKLRDQHNAHYRIRGNFALLYAVPALAIEYGVLPWGKNATFRDIEKCMRCCPGAVDSQRSRTIAYRYRADGRAQEAHRDLHDRGRDPETTAGIEANTAARRSRRVQG